MPLPNPSPPPPAQLLLYGTGVSASSSVSPGWELFEGQAEAKASWGPGQDHVRE